MAIAFREWPWPVQVLVYGALAVVIIVAVEFAPAPLPLSARRQELKQLKDKETSLRQEVASLQNVERRHAELKAQMEASEKQLETLRQIVPEEKEVDQFILQLQEGASLSGVSIRKLVAKPIVSREFHYDMPFDVEVDGPYFGIQDFFYRLSRMSRIINVGDLKFAGLSEQTAKYRLTPGTTVTGTLTVVTFFTKTAEQMLAAQQAGQPAKR